MKPPDLFEPLAIARTDRIVVIAPHPDDDVLGCGALVAAARAAGTHVEVVFLTDGEASHAPTSRICAHDLASIRVRESLDALAILGVDVAYTHRLHLPDGELERLSRDARRDARSSIANIVDRSRATLVLAPWRRDPHPDHRAGGDLARAATEVRALEYVVWLEERGDANDFPRAGEAHEMRFTYRAALARRKRRALMAHRSQTIGLAARSHDPGFLIGAEMIARACNGTERYYDVARAA